MAHDVFLSYSTPDKAAANAICMALEQQGIKCWIAPRDVVPGSHWGGSIVDAIEASKAVLVIFSQHSNESPQVVREMECAVGKRLPLIPVRVADARPTEDMQYFLGVSHWFDAFPNPLYTYLPAIVDSTRRVLAGDAAPWKRFLRRLPQNRLGLIAAGGAFSILVATVIAYVMKPAAPPNPMDLMKSPLAGRWEAELPDAQGKERECIFDVQDLGQVVFSDSCPVPLAGEHGNFTATRDGTWAPNSFVPGRDNGSFLIEGGALHGATGTYRFDGKTRVVLNSLAGGAFEWKRIKADAPLKSGADSVVPATVEWPLRGVPGIAQRAVDYARTEWQPDAFMTRFTAELMPSGSMQMGARSPAGSVQIQITLFSPSQQQLITLMPNSPAGSMFPSGSADPREQHPLPTNFLDLPEAFTALQARGMRGKQIKRAELENWSRGTTYGSAALGGVEWMIDSNLDERGTVPAGINATGDATVYSW
jgi:hypothetical protein